MITAPAKAHITLCSSGSRNLSEGSPITRKTCSPRWQPSFFWLVLTGVGGGPLGTPLGSATALLTRYLGPSNTVTSWLLFLWRHMHAYIHRSHAQYQSELSRTNRCLSSLRALSHWAFVLAIVCFDVCRHLPLLSVNRTENNIIEMTSQAQKLSVNEP